ncbi:MAG: hypothetical protein R3338_03165 [Thermoanaerobaculia bacterium]|nr:hypothetical protein [Thermoanaerobaculia bacterium]
MFPEHIEAVLNRFGVDPETKAALHQLYLSMGEQALEAFADLASSTGGSVAEIGPEAVGELRPAIVRSYLRDRHPSWLEGTATPSFYSPRDLEGQASGVTIPLGRLGAETSSFTEEVERKIGDLVGEEQPVPKGIVTLTHHGHYCGRQNTVSFDVVADDLETAIDVGLAEGRQHTVPGSVGETTCSYDPISRVAVIWEVQPNVLKPGEGRNAAISKQFRRHRNWHVATMITAIEWLTQRDAMIYVLRGDALPAMHQVNPNAVLSETIQKLHEKTARRVAESLGRELLDPSEAEGKGIADSTLLNVSAGNFIREHGAAAALWKLV